MTTAVDISCPVCGIEPVEGFISHKHDCPFHKRRVAVEMEKERKKRDRAYRREDRRRKIYYWRSRSGEIALVVFFIIAALVLMWFGIEALEG